MPAFYLQGDLIIPVAPVSQHTGEANPKDDLTPLVAVDEHGKAQGIFFEDEGDGYEYTNGGYLLTTYVTEQQSSVVTVKVTGTEGFWKRPNRCLHVQLFLGKGDPSSPCYMGLWGNLEPELVQNSYSGHIKILFCPWEVLKNRIFPQDSDINYPYNLSCCVKSIGFRFCNQASIPVYHTKLV